MRKGAAHCPTKSAQSSLPEIFSKAEMAIDPSASPKNKLDGACDVFRSIAPVTGSSLTCPRSTLVSIFKYLLNYHTNVDLKPTPYAASGIQSGSFAYPTGGPRRRDWLGLVLAEVLFVFVRYRAEPGQGKCYSRGGPL